MHLRRVLATLAILLITLAPAARARGDGNPAAATQGGYMGAQLEAVTNGLRVVGVAPSGPAANAGLQAGDVIIRARGGPTGAVENFTMSVRAAGAGSTYPLVVVRGTQQVTLNVQLTGLPSRQGMAVGSAPPPLAGLLVMGPGPADLAQLRGRVVVIDFWASWCGPCRQLMPALNTMHQRYAAQGLTVLGVTDESAAIARMVGSQMSVAYTLASEPTAASRYGVQNLPTTVVLDRRGTVRRIAAGVDGDELRRLDTLVRQLLAEPAP